MNSERERKLFLHELQGHGYEFKNTTWLDGLGKCGGTFEDDNLNMVWEMWCASASRQGYKLVPVEPTKEMISVGMGVFSFPLDNGRFSDCELIFSYREMIGEVDNK